MSSAAGGHNELLSALDHLFAKYFEERDESVKEKTSIDRFWETYSRAMKDEDEARPKDWDGNTGSILTFTGLFAATVAAFVIESYKALSPDYGDQTVALLTQLLSVTATNSSSHFVALSTPIEPFRAPLSAVIANALWFCSLVVALACALLATLVQQWSRDYVRDIKQRDILDENATSRALNHVYIRMGVDRYGLDGVVNVIVALVHLSVILFAAGLLLFLFPINDAVSWCTVSALALLGTAYLIASNLPIFDTSCPYRTPLTYPIGLVQSLFVRIINKQGPRKRRIPRRMFDFMSFPRFEFIWKHTSHHLLLSTDFSSMKTVVESMLEMLVSVQDADARSASINLLMNDSMFAYKLDRVPIQDTSDAHLRDATVIMTCILLQKCYTQQDTWDADDWRLKMSDYLRVLLSMLSPTAFLNDVRDITPLGLPVRLALFRLRWFLLLECAAASNMGSNFNGMEFNLLYFSPQSVSRDWRSKRLFDQRMIEHPEAILSLLNSRLYNPLEGLHFHDYRAHGYENGASCLIPLHDDECCTQRDGPLEHIAACTILTMIAHLLRAAREGQSGQQYIDILYQDIPLWEHSLSFTNWHRVFRMTDHECQRAPSREFLEVLYETGFDDWLRHGSDTVPLPVLDAVVDPYSSTVTVAEVIQNLAKHVDLNKASRFTMTHDLAGDVPPATFLLREKERSSIEKYGDGRLAPRDFPHNSESVRRDSERSVPKNRSPRLKQVVIDPGVEASPPKAPERASTSSSRLDGLESGRLSDNVSPVSRDIEEGAPLQPLAPGMSFNADNRKR